MSATPCYPAFLSSSSLSHRAIAAITHELGPIPRASSLAASSSGMGPRSPSVVGLHHPAAAMQALVGLLRAKEPEQMQLSILQVRVVEDASHQRMPSVAVVWLAEGWLSSQGSER